MSHSCLPTGATSHAHYGNAVQYRRDPTLTGLPEELMDGLIRFNPDSVRALRVVARALRRTGENVLVESAERIITVCQGSHSILRRLVCNNFIQLHLRQWNQPDRFGMQFHLSIPGAVETLGVPVAQRRARILSCEEISEYDAEVQRLQDLNLEPLWASLRMRVLWNGLHVQLPQEESPPEVIRSWIHTHLNFFQTTRFDLNDQDMTCVPSEVGLFTGLRRLDLSCNLLGSLPEGLFSGLVELQHLNLFRNRLHSLPEGLFSGLVNLQSLNLSENRLVALPEGLFSGLGSLSRLYLSSNDLTTLPRALFHGLARLEHLMVHANPLMFSHDGYLPTKHHRVLVEQMDTFFNYQCRSAFAGVYQLAAASHSVVAVRDAFLRLPDPIKNSIYGWVWEEAGRPQTPDCQWGGTHAFDDMDIFRRASLGYVRGSFGALGDGQKEEVYRHVCELADVGARIPDAVRECWARSDILRLIDAMMLLQASR